MKNTLLILMTFLTVSLHGQTVVEIINNRDVDIFVAYVFYNVDNQSWDSKGWYKVDNYSTTKLNIGDYRNDHIYLHATATRNNKKLSWGKGIKACIDSDQKFHFKAVDKIKNCQEKADFSKATVSPGKIVKHYYN